MTTLPEKACAECGESFAYRSNRARYCDKCAAEIKKRKAALRQAKRREKLRDGRPPIGPDEAQVNRDCDQIIATADQLLRLRPGQPNLEEMLLFETFPDGGYNIVMIGRSKASGDLSRLGRHDGTSEEYQTEKLIAGPQERRAARAYLTERLAQADDELRRILRNATRRGRRRSKA